MAGHYSGEVAMTEQTTEVKDAEEKKASNWVVMGIVGIVLAGPAPWFIYHYLDQKERQGGTIRMNWIAVLLYDLLGKWGVTVALLIFGVGSLLAAVWEFSEWRTARRAA